MNPACPSDPCPPPPRTPRRHPLALAVGIALALAAAALAPVGGTASAAGAVSVSGRVTNTAGAPLEDMEASAWMFLDGRWSEIDVADTDANGVYVIDGLAPGTYRVSLDDPFGDYVTQWWRGAPSVETASDITLGDGQSASGIDAALSAAPGAIVNLVAPHVVGTLRYGERLSADVGTWSQDGLSFTYDWFVTGRSALNGTGPTFRLQQPADAPARGLEVVLVVTASKPGLEEADADAPAVRVGARDDDGQTSSGQSSLKVERKPRIVGRAVLGRTLVLRPGKVSPAASVSVRWLRGTRTIRGAQGARLRVTRADVGSRLRAVVTFRRAGEKPLTLRTPRTDTVRIRG